MKVQVPANEAMADILEEAATYIKAGWTQGRPFEYVDGQRYVCANGALWLAAGLQESQSAIGANSAPLSIMTLFFKARRVLMDHVGEDPAGWNDSIGQTQGRVADTMLQLAKELRNSEDH